MLSQFCGILVGADEDESEFRRASPARRGRQFRRGRHDHGDVGSPAAMAVHQPTVDPGIGRRVEHHEIGLGSRLQLERAQGSGFEGQDPAREEALLQQRQQACRQVALQEAEGQTNAGPPQGRPAARHQIVHVDDDRRSREGTTQRGQERYTADAVEVDDIRGWLRARREERGELPVRQVDQALQWKRPPCPQSLPQLGKQAPQLRPQLRVQDVAQLNMLDVEARLHGHTDRADQLSAPGRRAGSLIARPDRHDS